MSGLADSPSQIIAQLLINLALATDPQDDDSWPVYNAAMPDGPNNSIAVYATPGRLFGRTQVDGQTQEHYGIQVKVRGETHDEAYAKLKSIIDAFDSDVRRETVTIAAVSYIVHSINRASGPSPALKENPQSRRYLFTINCLASIT